MQNPPHVIPKDRQPESSDVTLPAQLSLEFKGLTMGFHKAGTADDPYYNVLLQYEEQPVVKNLPSVPCAYDSLNKNLVPDESLLAAGKTFYIKLRYTMNG